MATDKLIGHLIAFRDNTGERIDSICFSKPCPGLPAGMERTVIGIDDERLHNLLYEEFDNSHSGPRYPAFTAWSANYVAMWTEYDGIESLDYAPARPAAPSQMLHSNFGY